MPPPPEAPSRRAARWMLAVPGRTLEAAAELHKITPQAVSRAAARLTSRSRMGRPPSSDPRRHTISVGPANLRASDAELAAYRRAAGGRPLAAWLREAIGPRRLRGPEMRRRARAAAGMSEE